MKVGWQKPLQRPLDSQVFFFACTYWYLKSSSLQLFGTFKKSEAETQHWEKNSGHSIQLLNLLFSDKFQKKKPFSSILDLLLHEPVSTLVHLLPDFISEGRGPPRTPCYLQTQEKLSSIRLSEQQANFFTIHQVLFSFRVLLKYL